MSANFFGLLEDVSSNDPVEIARKRQQDASNAKKLQEKKQAEEKQAQQQKEQQSSSAAKKTTTQKKPQTGASRQTGGESGDVAAEGFEQRDNRAKRGGRGGRGGKHHVGPRTGRQFDRESGTGRGKEVSKNGGGARNWGKAGDEVADVDSTKKPFFKKNAPKKQEETPTTPVEDKPETPVDNAENAEATTTEQTAPVETKPEEEEEEDNTITYDKLLAEKKKAKAQKPAARKAGEGVTTDPALLKGEVVQKKAAADVDLPIQEEGVIKKKKSGEQKKEKKTQATDSRVGLGEFFKGDKDALESIAQAQQYRPPRSSRGGRGGNRGDRGGRGSSRGGSRGGRGRGAKSTPSFNPSDFPTLK